MVEKGVIEILISLWVVFVVLVCKKDVRMYFCVDYYWFNEVIVKDVYLFLKIEEVFDYFLGYVMFFILDFSSGYW